MRNGLTPKQQGDRGEVSALEWLVHQGAEVFAPITSSPDVDLVALFDGRPVRVQVKTYIPADAVAGANVVNLGGPKYAAYEVEPGRPLPAASRA